MRSHQDVTSTRRPLDADELVSRGAHRARERRDLVNDAFERLPYGIAIADATGAILTWNRALEELVAPCRIAEDMRCCDLFGCRRLTGPCAGGCLTEAAIGTEGRLPEMRVDLPALGRSLWVTASALRGDAPRVVLQVRPADLPDVDFSAPRTGSGLPWLRIFTLGRARVETPEGPLAGEWLEQRPGQLLKFLACERHRVVATEEIAETLWPNPRTATPNTVRHFVHALRERLEPARPRHGRSSLLVARRGGYTLHGDNVWIDADEFEESVGRGLAAFADGRRAAAVSELEHALALYRGDFLAEDPYAEWAFSERERLRELVARPLRALRELCSDDAEASAGYLERLAQMEPFDHELQRQLLTLWIRQGRLSRAARHYRAFELRLLREFGGQPEFSLSELAVRRA